MMVNLCTWPSRPASHWLTAFVAFLLCAGSAQAECNKRETLSRDYGSTRAWLDAGEAATREYGDCLERERAEFDRQFSEQQAAKKDEERRRQALSNATRNSGGRGISMSTAVDLLRDAADKVGEKVTDKIVEAPGDKAVGAGGPRDASVDKMGAAVRKAANKLKIKPSNGIAEKLSDTATRSAVDVNSRVMGTMQAEVDKFGAITPANSPASSSTPSATGFAHLPDAPPPFRPSFSSVKVQGASGFHSAISAAASTGQTATGWRTGTASSKDLAVVPETATQAVQSVQYRQSAEGTRVQQAYEDEKAAWAERRRRAEIEEAERREAAAALARAQYAARMRQIELDNIRYDAIARVISRSSPASATITARPSKSSSSALNQAGSVGVTNCDENPERCPSPSSPYTPNWASVPDIIGAQSGGSSSSPKGSSDCHYNGRGGGYCQ